MTKHSPVGIEAIATYTPRHVLDLGTLAAANGVDPDKYNIGLGCRRMAVTAPWEDSLTMASEAAWTLLERYAIDPESIGLIVVGTETAIDAAKPIAAYIHGILDLSPRCRTFDAKHACYGGTAALRIAADWCLSGSNHGRKALVIAADIARYEIGSPGEPTQGAGAVAMLVGDEASVLALDPYEEGVFTRDVMDFWRPHYQSTAVVDGHASIDSYLRALEYTYDVYETTSGLGFDDYDYLLFHVPFPKMALKAYTRLHKKEAERRNGQGYETLESGYKRRVNPALWANMELGNIYSGSVYLSLASLLEKYGNEAAGKKLGLFSYGSGCCAEFYSGTVGPDRGVWDGRIGLSEGLRLRIELGHEEYLSFRSESEILAEVDSYRGIPANIGHRASIAFCGIRDHQRIYCISEAKRRFGHQGKKPVLSEGAEEMHFLAVRVNG